MNSDVRSGSTGCDRSEIVTIVIVMLREEGPVAID